MKKNKAYFNSYETSDNKKIRQIIIDQYPNTITLVSEKNKNLMFGRIKKSNKPQKIGDIFVISLFKGEYLWGKIVSQIEYDKITTFAQSTKSKEWLYSNVVIFDITTTNYDKLPDNWEQRKVFYRFEAFNYFWKCGYAVTVENELLNEIDQTTGDIVIRKLISRGRLAEYPEDFTYKCTLFEYHSECLTDGKSIEYIPLIENNFISYDKQYNPTHHDSTNSMGEIGIPAPHINMIEILAQGYRGLNPIPSDINLIERIKAAKDVAMKKYNLDPF